MTYRDKEKQKLTKKLYHETHKEQRKTCIKNYYQANKKKINVACKIYYQANKESIDERCRAWHKAHPNYNKDWAQANSEYNKARYKIWREANPEKEKAFNKAWRKANPEKSHEISRRRRISKLKIPFETINEKIVYFRDGWICQICHKKVNKRLKHPHSMCASLDHIVPLSKGGTHIYANVQLTHLKCNQIKKTNILPQGEQLRMF